MNNDLNNLQGLEQNVILKKEDLNSILDLLYASDGQGLLSDLSTACGQDSSLGIAITELAAKVSQARTNVIPEVNNLIKIFEDNK